MKFKVIKWTRINIEKQIIPEKQRNKRADELNTKTAQGDFF